MVYEPPIYPTDIPTEDNFTIIFDDIDMYWAKYHNQYNKEIRAVMTELGLLPKGSHADVTARLNYIANSLNIVTKTSAYTAATTDNVIICGPGNETFTVDLPAPVSGKTFSIKNVGTGIITVDANATGGTTIDGNNTQALNQYDCIYIISDGTAYWIV